MPPGISVNAPSARSEFDDEIKRRQSARDAAGKVVTAAQGRIPAIQKATALGRRQLGAASALGIASAFGQAGRRGGAGAAPGVRQAAMSRGLAQAGFEGQQALALSGAQERAASAELERQVFEQEQGKIAGQRQQKQAALTANIHQIVERHTGTFLGLWDDEGAAAREIEQLAQFQDDPAIVEFLMGEAARVRGNAGGSFRGGGNTA